MARILTALSTSLDGFIAGAHDSPDQPLGAGGAPLFDWLTNGDTPSRHNPAYRLSPVSATFFDEGVDGCGAVVAGRRTYDVSRAWGGTGPIPGLPLFVLTHHVPANVPAGEPAYTFVTDGIESAVGQARKAAEDRNVFLMGADTVQQCLKAGLLDEIIINLVPVLLGGGVRLLDRLGQPPPKLECSRVIDAPGVTHLTYRVTN
jgi:dihydrofolate reductase